MSPVARRTDVVVEWVFTLFEHRKHGYANHLLSLLYYALAPAALSLPFPTDLLGSGHEPDSRAGWLPCVPVKRGWDDVTRDLGSLGPNSSDLKWLDYTEVQELGEEESGEVQKEVDNLVRTERPETIIAFLPSKLFILLRL